MKLYHCTTPKKAEKYKITGCIWRPVRGWNTIEAARNWARKTLRSIIYEIEVDPDPRVTHPLPDHKNKFGRAYWTDDNVKIDRLKEVK